MKKVEDILNMPGEFSCDVGNDEVSLIGLLKEYDNYYILECQKSQEDDSLDLGVKYQLTGKVANRPVTLHDCYVIAETYNQNSIAYKLDPSEIIIGYNFTEEIKISSISMDIPLLNKLFERGPLKVNPNFNSENPYVLEYLYPQALVANDNDGTLSIQQLWSQNISQDEIRFEIYPAVIFKFIHSVSLKESILKIQNILNLLSLLADFPISTKSFEFSIGDKSDMPSGLIYMNYTTPDIESKNYFHVFLLTNRLIRDDFQIIWENWNNFLKQSRPIVSLFSSILNNQSKGINQFLNLCQCLEVYSNRYRSIEAQSVRNMYPADRFGHKNITLKHRLEDLLLMVKSYIDITPKDSDILARGISNARNFFTHYDPKNRKEPELNYIFSANVFLRLVLLLVVYERLGINKEKIMSYKHYPRYANIDWYIKDLK